ncbi:MAG: HIT domain-containing protein [bacterium]
MDLIWAPWRGTYIKMNVHQQECIFCYFDQKPIKHVEPNPENLVLYKSETCFIILNKYPYINGHLMVVPYRHTNDILTLDEKEKADIFNQIQFSVEIIMEAYNPSGFNIGINLGKVAGAGIDQHLHFHIVPRFNADHNFLTTISNTRIISFSLEETYRDLYQIIKHKKTME